jgi:hypothetical protein
MFGRRRDNERTREHLSVFRLLLFSDELEPDSIAVATLYAVTDAREKPGAVIFRMQLNESIFR